MTACSQNTNTSLPEQTLSSEKKTQNADFSLM